MPNLRFCRQEFIKSYLYHIETLQPFYPPAGIKIQQDPWEDQYCHWEKACTSWVLWSIKQVDLFALDINDLIWENVKIEKETVALSWLCDEEMCKRIRLVLQPDQCEEEECRIKAERGSIQEWFAEKWNCITRAVSTTGKYISINGLFPSLTYYTDNVNILCQLCIHMWYLLQLSVAWQNKELEIPGSNALPK